MDTPPGPGPLRLIRDGISGASFIPGFFADTARRYGDVASLGLGPFRAYLVSGPDQVQQVLVDHAAHFEKGKGERRFTRRLLDTGVLGSEGAYHDRQHFLIEPTVHGKALERFADAVAGHAERTHRRWSPGRDVDAFEEMADATSAAMVEVMFGHPPGTPGAWEMSDALGEAVDALESLPAPVLPGAERLPLPANRRFDQARDRLDRLIAAQVAERRRSGSQDDLLGALVAARHPDGSGMTDEQVRDEALTVYRGHKTTGTLVCWCWYLMARHPGAEEAVLAEVDAVVGDRPPEAADVPKLEKTRRLVDEALRLFPPAWMMARRAESDTEVGGFPVPTGTTVIVSPYVVHRDPRWHPEPRRFDPDRFLPERRAGWHPYAYFPFGGGPKMCLGDEFAWFEATLFLATVGRRWRLRLVPDHPVAPAPRATLQFRDGLRVTPERR
jgi:cytochrome P450